MNDKLDIYTDGGCRGNPGLGAWAFYVPKYTYAESEAVSDTTNNRMELIAAIKSLLWIERVRPISMITVYTDSQYVQKGITEWLDKWLRNNWKASNRKPVLNKQLWEQLHMLNEQMIIRWVWVKGHDNNEYNELCDTLVNESMSNISI